MASSSKEKRSMALLSSSPFFLKAPLRGKGALRAACLQSACGARVAKLVEQAGRGPCRPAAACIHCQEGGSSLLRELDELAGG